jgi:hypothetical protein
MAVMKKVVKVTGTAKSTSGSSASKNIKLRGLGSSSDKAQLKKAAVKGLKQTKADMKFRGETNQTADTARRGNLARVADKAAAKNKASLMKNSARSHQGDLARMSGDTASTNRFKADKAAGKKYKETPASPSYKAYVKAERRTLKSFK